MPSVIAAGTTSGTSLNLSGDTSGVLQLQTNGVTPALTIDTAQNVGIGTASPSERLEISGSGNQRLKITNTTSGASASLWLASNSKNAYVYNNDGVLNVYNGDASSPTVFSTNATERMRITSAGYVGIGNTTPTQTLDVGGVGGTSPGDLTVKTTSTDAQVVVGRLSGVSADNTTFRVRNRVDANAFLVTTGNRTAQVGTTFGVGDTTPASSGAGITFPATQSASSDANTLDDYEEGTWTPTIGDGLGASVNGAGFYTKIGRLVYLVFEFENVSRPSGVNTGSQLIMAGLPFSTGNEGVRSPRNYPIGLFVNIGGTNLGAYGGYSWRTRTDTTMNFQMASSVTNQDVQSPTWSQMPTTGSGGMYIRGYLVYNAT